MFCCTWYTVRSVYTTLLIMVIATKYIIFAYMEIHINTNQFTNNRVEVLTKTTEIHMHTYKCHRVEILILIYTNSQ